MKVIYNAISKTLVEDCKEPKNARILSLWLTVTSLVNISGINISSGLGIKPGTKLLGLNDKSKTALRNRLSEVKYLIIDDLLKVSSNLWTNTDSRLRKTIMLIS